MTKKHDDQLSEVQWKVMPHAVPLHVAQMIIIDRRGRAFLIHRSELVRSAKNVWSFPSGMHDIGELISTTVKRESFEEFNLEVVNLLHVGMYENIAVADQYHWVISVVVALVDDLDEHINKEPEKHDRVCMERLVDMTAHELFENYHYHASFVDWATANWEYITAAMRTLLLQ